MKKVISIFLAVLILVTVFPLSAFAENTSEKKAGGTCGDNLTWTLYNDGELVISGTGAMTDYNTPSQPYRLHNTPIKKVTINNGVTSIGYGAFAYCENLTNITIPNSVTSIGELAFFYCNSLTSIILPNDVTFIGDSAFQACENLTSFTIPEKVTSIGEGTFFGCANLTSITLADNVTSIGDTAFAYCDSLTNITIPNSVTSIGMKAFWCCENLTSIIIPNSVAYFGEGPFAGCDNLTNIIVDSNNPYYFSDKYGVLFNKNKSKLIQYPAGNDRTEYTVPSSVTFIGDDAFSNSGYLVNITIPDNVTSIADYAFRACFSLENISIPDSVTSIGKSAFEYCDSLETVYYAGTEEQWKSITVKQGNEILDDINIIFNADNNKKSIAIFSTEKSLNVELEDSFNLGFSILDNTTGMIDETWRKMAIVVSDPTIISLSDYKTNEYGYSIDVTGKKAGSTNVTITDTESGASVDVVITVYDSYNKSYSYNIESIVTFNPENKWESDISTNIYDLNGLFVNNYNCTKNGNKYKVSFDVYNKRYHTAAVDIYNAQGEWIDCEPIEKFSDISSLWDTGEQIYHLIVDPINGKWLTYEQSALSKHTPIEIEVPEGGYFTISNNFAESPGTFLFNASEILYNGACTLIDLFTADEIKFWEFSGLLKKNIVDNEFSRKEFFELFISAADSEIRDYTKNILEGNIDDACSGLSGLLENMLSSLKIEWKHLFKSVTGLGQSAFEVFAGAAGVALKGCFEITDLSNQLLQARHLAISSEAPYATVYSKITEGFINPHGIVVNTNGNIDTETVLQVFGVSYNDSIETILNSDNPFEKHELYNICFVKNDKLVQPNGKVKVQIPVPTGMKGDTCKIYRQEPDNSWTILDAHVEGNYLVFETDHFSLYAVVGDMAELTIHSLPDKINYLQDDILDTEGLILDLNSELITDGYLCNPAVMSGCGLQTITVTYGHATTQFDVYTHTPGEWEVITPAQIDVDGLEQQKCTVCGEVLDERVIPALGDSATFTQGDLNGDGTVNASDARTALRISAKLETPTDIQKKSADVNSDGRITASDARIILRVSAKLETL